MSPLACKGCLLIPENVCVRLERVFHPYLSCWRFSLVFYPVYKSNQMHQGALGFLPIFFSHGISVYGSWFHWRWTNELTAPMYCVVNWVSDELMTCKFWDSSFRLDMGYSGGLTHLFEAVTYRLCLAVLVQALEDRHTTSSELVAYVTELFRILGFISFQNFRDLFQKANGPFQLMPFMYNPWDYIMYM